MCACALLFGLVAPVRGFDNTDYSDAGAPSVTAKPGTLADNGLVIAEDPAEFARMRMSDADRDRAASVLSAALAEGRLTAEEHAERLDAIYASRTHAEIVPLVSDLPGATAALRAP